ncbi:hypothetical protein [Streptomyces azureus]|uniref:hypothetical protein n=1 Tax=Streptomyces azureus TaxID=146537 RepID=UPI0007517756|nr:hypothetical protein [Streptomyces azureus]
MPIRVFCRSAATPSQQLRLHHQGAGHYRSNWAEPVTGGVFGLQRFANDFYALSPGKPVPTVVSSDEAGREAVAAQSADRVLAAGVRDHRRRGFRHVTVVHRPGDRSGRRASAGPNASGEGCAMDFSAIVTDALRYDQCRLAGAVGADHADPPW